MQDITVLRVIVLVYTGAKTGPESSNFQASESCGKRSRSTTTRGTSRYLWQNLRGTSVSLGALSGSYTCWEWRISQAKDYSNEQSNSV